MENVNIEQKARRGRKPIADKKLPVNLLLRQSDIERLGGKDEVKRKFYEFVGAKQD